MTIRGSGIGGVRPGLSTHSASSTKHRLSENASRSAFFAAARDAHLGLSRDAVAARGGAPRGEWCGATGGSVGSRNTGRAGCRFNSAEAAAASHHRRSARRLCLQPGVWGPRWRMSRSRSSPFTLLITSPPCSPGGGPTPPPGGPSTPIPSTSSGQRVSATAAVHGTPPGSLSPPPSPGHGRRGLYPPPLPAGETSVQSGNGRETAATLRVEGRKSWRIGHAVCWHRPAPRYSRAPRMSTGYEVLAVNDVPSCIR